jgi:hypothetical protein
LPRETLAKFDPAKLLESKYAKKSMKEGPVSKNRLKSNLVRDIEEDQGEEMDDE